MGTEVTVRSGPHLLAVKDFGGEGPALLLIHGAGMNAAAWGPLARDLGADHRVLAYDLPGHGHSAGSSPATFENTVASIGAVVSTLGLDDVCLIGHSLGGIVGVEHLGRGGAGRGLINVDGWMGPPVPNRLTDANLALVETQLSAMATATVEGLDQLVGLQRSLAPGQGLDPDAMEELTRRSYSLDDTGAAHRCPSPAESISMMQALAQVDLRHSAESIPVPVLFVMATESQASPLGPNAEEFQADRTILSDWLSCAQWAVARIDCSHMIPLLRPAELATHIRTFLGTLG